ncbi:MAG: hypothetical protein KJO07_21870 [Deltaproteobacteria bacterium]|nr:hypothetical protein [Deltaproteobacteria bacterium]
MLTELLDIRAPWTPGLANQQPAVVAFINAHVAERGAQRVALDIASRLLATFARFHKELPALCFEDLEDQHRQLTGDDEHPARGWRYALPIALPPNQARSVSRVLGAIVGTVDPRFAAR